jgi:hypothetical protein
MVITGVESRKSNNNLTQENKKWEADVNWFPILFYIYIGTKNLLLN